jgi:hypothetical protein
LGQSLTWWVSVGITGTAAGLVYLLVSRPTLQPDGQVAISLPSQPFGAALAGAILAIPQWFAARQQPNARLWIPSTTLLLTFAYGLGFGIGVFFAFAVMILSRPMGWDLQNPTAQTALVASLVVVLPAVMAASVAGVQLLMFEWLRSRRAWLAVAALGGALFLFSPYVPGTLIYAVGSALVLARSLQHDHDATRDEASTAVGWHATVRPMLLAAGSAFAAGLVVMWLALWLVDIPRIMARALHG